MLQHAEVMPQHAEVMPQHVEVMPQHAEVMPQHAEVMLLHIEGKNVFFALYLTYMLSSHMNTGIKQVTCLCRQVTFRSLRGHLNLTFSGAHAANRRMTL